MFLYKKVKPFIANTASINGNECVHRENCIFVQQKCVSMSHSALRFIPNYSCRMDS